MTGRHRRRQQRGSPPIKHYLTTSAGKREWITVVLRLKMVLGVISEVAKVVQTLRGY
jgi:hypothetical protein